VQKSPHKGCLVMTVKHTTMKEYRDFTKNKHDEPRRMASKLGCSFIKACGHATTFAREFAAPAPANKLLWDVDGVDTALIN